MTTKFKVSAGFSFMVLLLAAMAAMGYFSLQQISRQFQLFGSESDTAVNANGGSAMFRDAKEKVSLFRLTVDSSHITTAKQQLDRSAEYLKEARASESSSKLKEELDRQLAKIDEARRLIDRIHDRLSTAEDAVNNKLRPAGLEVDQTLLELSTAARTADNAELITPISQIYSLYMEGRISVRQFSNVFEDAAADKALNAFAGLPELFEYMKQHLVYAENQKLIDRLNKQLADYVQGFRNVRSIINEATAAYDSLNTLSNELATFFDTYTNDAEQNMRNIGAAINEDSERTQALVLTFGTIGLVLGAVFAGWIIFGLVRTLNRVSSFAALIAKGDFSAPLDVREGGEIGALVKAMREIPTVLQTVTAQGKDLAGAVAVGRFRERFDRAKFSGGFAELTGSINGVGDAYCSALDSIPSPMLTFNSSGAAVFLNQDAAKDFGQESYGRPCDELLQPQTSIADLGRKAVRENSAQFTETTLVVKGNTIISEAIIAPLHNMSGKAEAFLCILTDVTAVRNAQNLMQQVAIEATEIADRVAAASEELSAQVEQVSQGAEMQRSRVESTAAAMNEMNSTVLEVARNAGHASEQSGVTRTRAEEGAALVNKVVDSINGVNTIATGLQGNMADLGNQAENIGGVMNVISDIADQTNLLALNAAIEAARAGEAGRGFAVVADEVRKLAEKTMEATHQVGSNISAIQQSAKSNIDDVVRAVKNVGEATELANASGMALQEILKLAGESSDVVANIATAAEQQSATSEEINNALEEVSRVVAETAEGMIQSSAAVQDLSRTAQELKQVMERLK